MVWLQRDRSLKGLLRFRHVTGVEVRPAQAVPGVRVLRGEFEGLLELADRLGKLPRLPEPPSFLRELFRIFSGSGQGRSRPGLVPGEKVSRRRKEWNNGCGGQHGHDRGKSRRKQPFFWLRLTVQTSQQQHQPWTNQQARCERPSADRQGGSGRTIRICGNFRLGPDLGRRLAALDVLSRGVRRRRCLAPVSRVGGDLNEFCPTKLAGGNRHARLSGGSGSGDPHRRRPILDRSVHLDHALRPVRLRQVQPHPPCRDGKPDRHQATRQPGSPDEPTRRPSDRFAHRRDSLRQTV